MREPTDEVIRRLLRTILEQGVHLEWDDDYEWCRFCDSGVYLGGSCDVPLAHDPECPLAAACDELGVAMAGQ